MRPAAATSATLSVCLVLAAGGCSAHGLASAPKPPETQKTAIPKPSAAEEVTVGEALDALNRGDGDAAVRGLELALQGGSKSYLVDWTARGSLPHAYVAAGDLERAASRAEELMSGAPHDVRLGLRETRADIECARGNVDAAIDLYRALLDDVADEDEWHDGLTYTYFLEVRAKLQVLGKRLPEFAPEWTVGADRFEARGAVTILSFLTPFGASALEAQALQRLHALPGAPPVAAVVATDAHEHVGGPFELPQEMWEKPTQTTRERSASWRDENNADFPVLGVPPDQMPADSTLFRFHAVLDAQRRVVYVGSQSDPQGRLEEIVVRRLLAR